MHLNYFLPIQKEKLIEAIAKRSKVEPSAVENEIKFPLLLK